MPTPPKSTQPTQPPTDEPDWREPETEVPKRRPRRERPYGRSLLGMVCHVEEVCPSAQEPLTAIVAECLDTDHSLIEACWNAVAKDAEIELSYSQLKAQAKNIATLAEALAAHGWMEEFLDGLAHVYRLDRAITPEDVLFHVRVQYDNFMMQLENTRHILRHHAEVVADEIQRVATERPDLIRKEADNAR